jgi:voltage-gated potassium channel
MRESEQRRQKQKIQQQQQRFPPGKYPFAPQLHVILQHPITELSTVFLVLTTCVVFALQTVESLPPLAQSVLVGFERGVSGLFAVEYFLRWYSIGRVEVLFTRSMLIDFFAVIMPLGLLSAQSQNQFIGLLLRGLRFSRVFQLQRLMEDEEMRKFFPTVTESRIRIANVLLTVFTIIYMSAGMFYEVEHEANPGITDMFTSLYYSCETLFTLGTGDITPVTIAGRFVSVATVLIGAVLVPLQLSEIVSVAMQAQSRPDPISSPPPPPQSALPTPLATRSSPAFASPSPVGVFNLNAECENCSLRVHQFDARFCRNCGAGLSPAAAVPETVGDTNEV